MSNKTYPYAYKMTPTHDDFPEVAVGHDLPEAYVQSPPETVWSPQPSIAPTYVSQPPSAYPPSAYGQHGQYTDQHGQYTDAVKPPGSAAGPPPMGGVMSRDASYAAPESTDPEKPLPPIASTVCGISLVLFLSIIIAILSAAVIGLAAGTGVAASNYNNANSKLQVLSSSLAAAQAKQTGTPTSSGSSSSTSGAVDWNSITNGCSDNPGDVTGLTYTSKSFKNANFTMICDKDTNSLSPVYSLFAGNFNGCMDACAGWNFYNTTKGKCVGVSFIPSWSVLATALAGNAPGDCYLKPAPLSKANLTDPNIGGGEIHTALLISKS
ncbi:hypothetical protein GGI43DRAFT_387363 [Trichoderma evansii]